MNFQNTKVELLLELTTQKQTITQNGAQCALHTQTHSTTVRNGNIRKERKDI